MKKILFIFMIIAFLLVGGCVSQQDPSPTQISIEWSDVIKWNGNKYYFDEEGTQNYSEDLVGKEIGEVTFKVIGSKEEDNPDYQIKDGEATFLPKGSKIYSVKDKEVSETILINEKIYSVKDE